MTENSAREIINFAIGVLDDFKELIELSEYLESVVKK